MTKEEYLEMKKQARVWFTVNILISLIAITGGSLVIISQSRHIPFFADVPGSNHLDESSFDHTCF